MGWSIFCLYWTYAMSVGLCLRNFSGKLWEPWVCYFWMASDDEVRLLMFREIGFEVSASWIRLRRPVSSEMRNLGFIGLKIGSVRSKLGWFRADVWLRRFHSYSGRADGSKKDTRDSSCDQVTRHAPSERFLLSFSQQLILWNLSKTSTRWWTWWALELHAITFVPVPSSRTLE